MKAETSLLSIKALTVQFGGLVAVNGVDLSLSRGQLGGLIGPNGAGKTSLFNALTGLCHAKSGDIQVGEARLVNKPAHFVARSGVARTFQNIRLFSSLSVLDNLRIGYHQNRKYPMLAGIFKTRRYYNEEQAITDKARKILDFVGLADKEDELACNLAYGQQRKLEIARALITDPQLLLLDEPAAGMNPNETRDLVSLIKEIQSQFDMTILLIEHDMSLVMGLCETISVLDYGKLIASGTPDEVRANPKVIQAYLGEESA